MFGKLLNDPWYCWILCILVSPLCVESGSASWKCGLMLKGTRRSASKEGGYTMGMSFVVLMEHVETLVPAEDPM